MALSNEQVCTPVEARWCRYHGNCTCPVVDGTWMMDDDSCPLHSPESNHPIEVTNREWLIRRRDESVEEYLARTKTGPARVVTVNPVQDLFEAARVLGLDPRQMMLDALIEAVGDEITEFEPDIHTYFGLTYANYLVLRRTVLQSMPIGWQVRFVKMLQEIEETLDIPEDTVRSFTVSAKDEQGRFMVDPVPHYDRGRARIPLKGQ